MGKPNAVVGPSSESLSEIIALLLVVLVLFVEGFVTLSCGFDFPRILVFFFALATSFSLFFDFLGAGASASDDPSSSTTEMSETRLLLDLALLTIGEGEVDERSMTEFRLLAGLVEGKRGRAAVGGDGRS